MTDYIELKEAIDLFYSIDPESDGSDGGTVALTSDDYTSEEIEEMLSLLPAADVAPVVHGRWTTPRAIIECSKCGFGMFPDGYFFEFGECVHAYESQYRPNFCPNCGAKLDLEND